MDRRLFTCALAAVPVTRAHAQAFPSRPITLIAPSVPAERAPLVRLGLLRKD